MTRDPGPPGGERPRRVPRALVVVAAIAVALVAVEFYALFAYGRAGR